MPETQPPPNLPTSTPPVVAVTLSLLLLLPLLCIPRLLAGDLPSHLYNAWLANQIHDKSIAGLSVAHQTSNIAVDLLLSTLLRFSNVYVAEHLVAAITLLIFFWGAFRIIHATCQRVSLWLVPWVAMLSYGFVFQMGLLNFCLSLGFCFFLFAEFVKTGRRDWLAIASLAALTWMAHPLPPLWLAGTLAFYFFCRRALPLYRPLLLAFACLVLAGIHHVLVNRLSAGWLPHGWMEISGASQFEIFGAAYRWMALTYATMTAIVIGILLLDLKPGSRPAIAVYLFLLQAAAVYLLPYQVAVPGSPASFDLITARFSLISGVALLTVLGSASPRLLYTAAATMLAMVYFVFLVRDMRALEAASIRLDATVQTLPAGSRVLLRGMKSPHGGQVPIHFMLERSCIGHCYAYANFEPSTRHFRLRATVPNPYVTSENRAVGSLISGQSRLQPFEAPLYVVQPCTADDGPFCISEYPAAD